MKQSIRFAPPNHMFFFEDQRGGWPPDIDDRDVRIWTSPSSLIVGTFPRDDGDTDLMVSTSASDAPDTLPRFDCTIDTPSRVLEVSTSEREILMSFDVAGTSTRIRVWSNHPRIPDKIVVVLG